MSKLQMTVRRIHVIGNDYGIDKYAEIQRLAHKFIVTFCDPLFGSDAPVKHMYDTFPEAVKAAERWAE